MYSSRKQSMASWVRSLESLFPASLHQGTLGVREMVCHKNGTVAWCVHLFKFTGLHKPFGTQNSQDEKEELLGNDRYWLSLRGSGGAQKQI